MDDNSPHRLSTSALAKALDIPSQQLFTTLKDYGWIRRIEDGWVLTNKGEFEGGEYVHSKKYGRYIVWPEELIEHRLFQAMEDNRHISATLLGKAVGLNAREVNRLLSELGWIKHGFQGWELTNLGQKYGGVQLENDSSGTFYVMWPQSIQQNAGLTQALAYSASLLETKTTQAEGDLFTQDSEYIALDGHIHTSKNQLSVCHWLYMAGIAHACKRRLPTQAIAGEELLADFYLPAHQLYIECWDKESSTSLAKQMQRKSFYDEAGLSVIDVEEADFQQLDEVLTRKFRQLGIRIY